MKKVVLCAALALVGCGGNMSAVDGGSGGGGGIVAGGGGGTTGGGSGGGGGHTGGGTGADAGTDAGTGPTGTSCADAIPLTLGVAKTGKLDTVGKKLYYSFSAATGDFLDLATKANPNDNQSGFVDTTITLYNAAGDQRLASIDDAYPRLSTDTEMLYRVGSVTSFCALVEDWATWAGDTSVVQTTNTFTLTVAKIASAAASVTIDTEPNDTAAAAQTGKVATSNGVGLSNFFGGLDTATDVDLFKITVPAGTTQVSLTLAPLGVPSGNGKNGYGSTLDRVTVRVEKTDGTIVGQWVVAQSAIATTPESIGVVVTENTDYLIKVERPTGSTAGANDFYALEAFFGTDNPAEAHDATNNDPLSPELLDYQVSTNNSKVIDGFVLGTIGAADVDHFVVPVKAGDSVAIACGALRNGSGLTGTYALYGAADGGVLDPLPTDGGTAAGPFTGVVVQTETETATTDFFWGDMGSQPAVTATGTGIYVFKVTGTQDPLNTGNYYRCGIHVTSP